MRGSREIAPATTRRSAITSHGVGIPQLADLLEIVPADAGPMAYRWTAVTNNAVGVGTECGRKKRFETLRRLYLFRPDSILFRSLRDLWAVGEEGRPLLAALCAMATDTVFRASASAVTGTSTGDEVAVSDFAEAIETSFPGAYAPSTLAKASSNAYASWQQSGHLGAPTGGKKLRQRTMCRPTAVAYALLLGHLQDVRGEALFDTLWARVLDRTPVRLYDLAFSASQQGMLEYRHAGGVVEVGFRELLRPMEGELL